MSSRVDTLAQEDLVRLCLSQANNHAYHLRFENVHICGVIRLFLCYTQYQQGILDKSEESLQRAMDILRRKPQFLIPGIETYLYHCV